METLFDGAARLAARQHGRISHAQLLAAGVDRDRIKRWRADGRLRPVHRGVYALGHTAPSVQAAVMAAVLACGRGAFASHRSAGHLLRVLAAPPALPEVSVPGPGGRRQKRIVIHRGQLIHPRDRARCNGIPITTVPRLLVDLAPRLDLADLTRACHEAWIHHRVTPQQVEACIARNPTKKGAAKLRRALGSDVTLSDLEDCFLALLERHGLPRPRTNIDRRCDKVDCHWPHLGLTVELLSYTFHARRRAFEQDVARGRRANHIAYTWGDVFERGARTAHELARLLR